MAVCNHILPWKPFLLTALFTSERLSACLNREASGVREWEKTERFQI